jgi:hypothetical protein
LKRPKVVSVQSPNRELHLILQDLEIYANPTSGKAFDEAKIKKIMMKEALKPLFLMREE